MKMHLKVYVEPHRYRVVTPDHTCLVTEFMSCSLYSHDDV